jgi:hypothetical protein
VTVGKLNPSLHVITVLEGFSNRVGLRDEERIIPENEAKSRLRPTPSAQKRGRMARTG